MTAIAAAVAIVVTGVTACSSSTPEEGPSELKIGLSFAPNFHPIQGSSDATRHHPYKVAVYDTLFLVQAEGDIQPSIATDWSYDDTRTVLSIDMRDDVEFTDGTPLNAEAVKTSIDLVRTESPTPSFYESMQEVIVTGDYSLEIRLSRPDPELLDWLDLGLASPDALAGSVDLVTTPVGSGPYLLESGDDASEYVFVRNPDYWNPDLYPYDRIVMTVLPDVTPRLNALKSGQIDFTELDATTAEEAEAAGFVTSTTPLVWVGVLLDREGLSFPAMADLRVRQAINMAFDRKTVLETVDRGYGYYSNQLGVEGGPDYVEELADMYEYDPDRARELLAEAGFPDGFDLTIPDLIGWPYLVDYKPYVEQALGEIGIRVTWEAVQDAFEAAANPTFGVWPTIARVDPAFDPPLLVNADAVWNVWHTAPDAEAQEILKVVDAGSPEEILAGRQEFMTKAIEEAWFAVYGHPAHILGYSPDVTLSRDDYFAMPHLSIIRPAD
jgi:peptide/nickel transport system substrate-binding protein